MFSSGNLKPLGLLKLFTMNFHQVKAALNYYYYYNYLINATLLKKHIGDLTLKAQRLHYFLKDRNIEGEGYPAASTTQFKSKCFHEIKENAIK